MASRPFIREVTMSRIPAGALAASALLAVLPALAQPAPDPLDAEAPVRAATYASPLARGRAVEATPIPWREANERVGRIGGWRAYAREASSPAPAAAASAPAQHHPGPAR
jgi:hypothetical protein